MPQRRWDHPAPGESRPDRDWDPEWDPAEAMSPVPRSRAGRATIFVVAAAVLAVLLVLLCVAGRQFAENLIDPFRPDDAVSSST